MQRFRGWFVRSRVPSRADPPRRTLPTEWGRSPNPEPWPESTRTCESIGPYGESAGICGVGPLEFHLHTLTIHTLGSNQNYYRLTPILRINIVLCSKVPCTKFVNHKCFEMKFVGQVQRRPGAACGPISAAVSGRQETGDRRQETGDGGQETGDRRRETGDRRQETRDGRRETGHRRRETGDRSQEIGHGNPRPQIRRRPLPGH